MPAGDTAPMFRVEDEAGEVLAEGAGVPGEETALSELIALEQGGLVRVVVESVDGGVDPDTAYALSLDVSADPDVFEPNDTPDQATALGSLRCAPGWGEWVSQSGYLATAGDSDWFDLELEGCARGILEAEVTFDGALPSGMRPALRMVRAVPDAPCSADQDCQALPMSCEDDLDCALFGNVCLASGDCGGVGFCLPDEETCGAALLSATAPADAPETLRISAPLVDLDRLRLSLADYQARVGSLDQAYTLRARVRLDPDRNEPSDVYTAGAPTSSGAAAQAAAAVDMQILSCVAPGGGGDTGDTGGGDAEQQCCADGSGAGWVEGSIGYAFDQDWYRYDHPCPGEDCMVRVHYAIDGGPVDVFTQVYRGSQLWYDSLAPVDGHRRSGAAGGHLRRAGRPTTSASTPTRSTATTTTSPCATPPTAAATARAPGTGPPSSGTASASRRSPTPACNPARSTRTDADNPDRDVAAAPRRLRRRAGRAHPRRPPRRKR